MPERPFAHDGQASIFVEVPSGSGGPAVGDAFVRAAGKVAQLFASLMGEGEEESPDSLEVTLGLGLTDSGEVIITQGQSAANFVVSLRWGGWGSAEGVTIPEMSD